MHSEGVPGEIYKKIKNTKGIKRHKNVKKGKIKQIEDMILHTWLKAVVPCDGRVGC